MNEPYQVDPALAFQALKRITAEQIATLLGDCAAKDAAIEQLREEVHELRTQLAEKAAESPPAPAPVPANGHARVTEIAEVVDVP